MKKNLQSKEKYYYTQNTRMLAQYGLNQLDMIAQLARIPSQKTLYQIWEELQAQQLLTTELIYQSIMSFNTINNALDTLKSTVLYSPLFIALVIKHPDCSETILNHSDLFEDIIHAEEQGLIPSISPNELYLFVDAVVELTSILQYRDYRSSTLSANDVYYMKEAKQAGDIVYLKAHAAAMTRNDIAFIDHLNIAANELCSTLYGKMLLTIAGSKHYYWQPLIGKMKSQPEETTSISYEDNLSAIVSSTKMHINETIKSVLQFHKLSPNLQDYIFSKLAYFDIPANKLQDQRDIPTSLTDHIEDIEYEIHNILRDHGVNFLEDMMFEHLRENPDSTINILESNHFNQNQATSAINAVKSYLLKELAHDKLLKADLNYQGSDPTHEGLFDHHHHNEASSKKYKAGNQTNEDEGDDEDGEGRKNNDCV